MWFFCLRNEKKVEVFLFLPLFIDELVKSKSFFDMVSTMSLKKSLSVLCLEAGGYATNGPVSIIPSAAIFVISSSLQSWVFVR